MYNVSSNKSKSHKSKSYKSKSGSGSNNFSKKFGKHLVNVSSTDTNSNTSHFYQIYHVGIIDYLQEWSVPKRFENKVKVFYDRKNRHKISAIHPQKYQERFASFLMSDVVKPGYECFKAEGSYVQTCEAFIESGIAKLRIYELANAGIPMHSILCEKDLFGYNRKQSQPTDDDENNRQQTTQQSFDVISAPNDVSDIIVTEDVRFDSLDDQLTPNNLNDKIL